MVFLLPVFTCILFFIYLNSSFFGINSVYYFSSILFDEFSLFIIFMACFVIYISFMFSLARYSILYILVLFFMLLVCCVVFVTDNMFYLYLFYEASLIPILYIIMKWGSYPERSVSSIILLLYTSVFSFPFLYVIFSFWFQLGTFRFSIMPNYSSSSVIFSLLIFFTFGVKLPIYGLHF